MEFNKLNKLDNFIMNESFDLFEEGTYICDEKAKESYIFALDALKKLCKQGKCKLRIDDPEKPFQCHAIHVTWIMDKNGMVEIATETLIKGLTEMNLLIDEIEPLEWQISKTIYSSK